MSLSTKSLISWSIPSEFMDALFSQIVAVAFVSRNSLERNSLLIMSMWLVSPELAVAPYDELDANPWATLDWSGIKRGKLIWSAHPAMREDNGDGDRGAKPALPTDWDGIAREG
jgi:hypothetical protein